MPDLTLTVLPEELTVCRLAPDATLPARPAQALFWSVTYTGDELSLVCPHTWAPPEARCETGWSCLRVEGPLDFALTGILNSLTAPLAAAAIPLFAISTFDTDYLLVKTQKLDAACTALTQAGMIILRPAA